MKKLLRILYLVGFLGLIKLILDIQVIDIKRPYDGILFSSQDSLLQNSKYILLDREGYKINGSSHINLDPLPLYAIPSILQQAFILSEDQFFYEHKGVDWKAKFRAIINGIKSGKFRGASTITEQVVRIIYPRPRNLWSKLLEAIEANILEHYYNKATILEFYLNNIPYASNHRGVQEAARYYFSRSVETLNLTEMLTLVILVRSPSTYDLKSNRDKGKLHQAVYLLANKMKQKLGCSKKDILNVKKESEIEAQVNINCFELQDIKVSSLLIKHDNKLNILGTKAFNNFVNSLFIQDKENSNSRKYLYYSDLISKNDSNQAIKITTTLDGILHNRVFNIIKRQLQKMQEKKVHNAAALVVEAKTGKILSWVSFGNETKKGQFNSHFDQPEGFIDAVLTPRQAGSTLKPFLYSLALEQGWTTITLLDDQPLYESVGHGLHKFHNYSHRFYKQVTLREALGNSLNIPAIHTLEFVGQQKYKQRLGELGFSLDKVSKLDTKREYGKGLALGNIEVSLYQLVEAYTSFMNKGYRVRLKTMLDMKPEAEYYKNAEDPIRFGAAEIIRDILQDPSARRMEFGEDCILNLTQGRSVKTGTSNDYRDAWAVGFDQKYVIGIWFGNLNHEPTDGVTGANGPALALRSIFGELDKLYPAQDNNYSENELINNLKVIEEVIEKREVQICKESVNELRFFPNKQVNCTLKTEFFLKASMKEENPEGNKSGQAISEMIPYIAYPYAQMHFAIDPRIPPEKQLLYPRGTITNLEKGRNKEDSSSLQDKLTLANNNYTENNIIWYIDGAEISRSTLTPSWQLIHGKHILKMCISPNISSNTNGGIPDQERRAYFTKFNSCDEVVFQVF